MRDKVVVVTGAFGALGSVVAQVLAAAGARLVLIDAAAMEHAPRGDHQVLAGVDLTNWEQARSAFAKAAARHSRIDALVNIAGGFRWERVDEGEPGTWDLLYAVNLKTALHACKAVLPHLPATGGRIVNIGANAAGRAALGMGAYAASKAGVLRLTEALAEELKDRGATVNAILPGIIDTPANRREMPQADVGRWVTPQAVAGVVIFLLTDAAQAVTGAGIPVTGRL